MPVASDEHLFDTGHRWPVRVVFGVFGLGALVLPAIELRPWTVPPPLGLLFWIIVLGAASLGAAFLAGALLARPGALSAAPGGLVLDEAGWRGRRRTWISAASVGAITVERFESDAGPDSYYVKIARQDGLPLSSGHFASPHGAENLARRIRDIIAP